MKKEFVHNRGDKYVITGVDCHGRQFKPIHTDNPHHALGYNLWCGSVWQIKAGTTKRKLIKRTGN